MIGKLIGAVIGERIAARHGKGAKGALIGAASVAVARRLFTPLGLALAGAYLAKKVYDRAKASAAVTPVA